MPTPLDSELQRLLVGTDEERRRVGQAFYHLYRTLVFWHPRGRTFLEITKAWAAAGATIFDTLAATLEALEPWRRDDALRALVGRVLGQLAEDLERGDSVLVPFLRWSEGLFPEITDLIRQEGGEAAIHDHDLARELSSLFAGLVDADRADVVRALRICSEGYRPA
ncbi:MAG: hypothetical protein ACC662_09380 [Planctomycetota bacterium]